ncbi:hypothetical protein [Deinococcus sp. Leaf326]|uniref:hypothetical protein n=1 Tax=Deinococcus sp. Leaf326 TaxID=1736338 RepID=UPI0012E14881|nr:hypothetical protein [Deinococcus sp. Leaf326]
MSEKRGYVYQVRAFGAPATSGSTAVSLDLNDVFTKIAQLDPARADHTGRILLGDTDFDSDPLFMHVLQNSKAEKIVTGIIGAAKSRNLPDQFDISTGTLGQLDIEKSLLEKTHFFIDTATGYMIYQRTKSSPNIGLFAYYIRSKLPKFVVSLPVNAHIRKDAVEKIQEASKRGDVKLFQLRIKRTALSRTEYLGPEVDDALKSISKIPGVESIGISIGLEKYKRKGGFSTDTILEGMKRFLGTQTSSTVMSDVELAEFKLNDEEVNLLSQKFTVQIDIPDAIMDSRHVDSRAVVKAIAQEYDKIKSDL